MTTAVPQRFHALDATRALALLLGIVLHATMSFFLPIPAQDVSHSGLLALVFYVIHSFRMCLFFLIAGFFARMALQRHGVRAFVKDRARRIGVPLIVGWLLLAPLTLGILILGISRSLADGAPVGADAAALAPQGFPLTHLWFLYYLGIFYVLALALRSGFVAWIDRSGALRARIDRWLAAGLSSHLAPLALAAPLFALLYVDPDWPVWFGIPTPDYGLAPQLPALVGFGTAFAFGWLLQRQTQLLDVWRRQWALNLLLAASLSMLCVGLVGRLPGADPFAIAGPPWRRLVYALSYSVSIWYWVSGLIGAAQRFCADASPLRRYLADASYWLYLVHLPLVFGLQLLMRDWPLHWTLKFPLILAITLGVLLPSYHYLVRSSFIGEILNGRKHPRRSRSEPDAAALPADSQHAEHAPLAQLSRVSKRYGATLALDDFSLDLRPGELLAVLGSNGAGKTTAIGLLLGTLAADSGDVSLMGGPPSDVLSRLQVGAVLQEVSLAPNLSAREHISLAASYYREPLSVAQTIALTGIEAFADRRYARLSGGQKRQVQFAIAVCGRPRLLFLDEPTVGLDVQAREALWRTIRALRLQGCSIVLTTHYLEEAQALADRVVVLARGKLIAQGSVDQVRALVTRTRIRCASELAVDQIRRWPGVLDAVRAASVVEVTTSVAEPVVRRLLDADPALSRLEVQQAGLAEALAELEQEAA